MSPAALPLRELILAALAEAAISRRDRVNRAAFCADCRPGRPCADHLQDLADADDYEAAYALMAAAASGVN